ncbi:uncharacterized protein EV422DRAFT_506619 [Fimicolochytrium jonesii]|uniref:uncharacterized protein n=1 Tax=Fimicolochytrium jonesii TaxID=1396493 RepID=UPI0022FEF899|nr:uncharacterized protein EV422DRAFT_506619 [Fimicolochytrium jonesii]KAI8820364.1 hypothetical protein EV422DRAFT_506619 [Fimicolochytrium jonesii]
MRFFGQITTAAAILSAASSAAAAAADASVCDTPLCAEAAKQISSAMDTTADPCTDFYQYSCGGWIKNHPIPAAKTRIGTFDDLNEANLQILRSALEAPYTPVNVSSCDQAADRHNFNIPQKLYKLCMDTEKIEKDGLKPIKDALKNLSGHLALGDNSDKLDATKTAKALAYLAQQGTNAVANLYIGNNPLNPDQLVITLIQPDLLFPAREYYNNTVQVSRLQNTTEAVLTALLPAGKTSFATRAAAVVDFEKKLADISQEEDVIYDPILSNNPYTLEQFNNLSKALPWTTYLQSLFPKKAFGDLINENTKLIVNSVDYFVKLGEVLSATPASVVEDSIFFRYTLNNQDTGAKALRDIFRDYLQKIGKVAKEEPARWQTCIKKVDASVGELSGRLFIAKAFGGDSKQQASIMIENIVGTFEANLPNIDWLDPATRAKALEKAQAVFKKIGYADIVMQPKKLAQKYKALKVGNSYVNSVIDINRWKAAQQLAAILKPADRTAFDMTPPTVNAYYNPPMNEIVFPAGILQRPFYGAGVPDYLNYGGIGMVIGHELTHGFDDNGRHYGGNGAVEDWWTNTTAAEFEQKAVCFKDQYSAFQVTGPDGEKANVDGAQTLGENLADNGGIAQSYAAWTKEYKSAEGAARNQLLPGITNTPEQLFFLSFAQVWCQNIRPEALFAAVASDAHAPARFRVAGTVANTPEFAQAFQCKAGTPLNPANRCKIW